MENNWKGSELPWYSDNDTTVWGKEINKRVCIFDKTKTFNGNAWTNPNNDEYKHNKQLLMDASIVRQQIDCSLPELLLRYKKMEVALVDINKLIENNNNYNDSGFDKIDWVLDLIRQSLNNK